MEQKKNLRLARLEIAVAICISEDGDEAAKQKVLKGICEADPVIEQVLKNFGVDVDLSTSPKDRRAVQRIKRLSALKERMLYLNYVKLPNSKDPRDILFRAIIQANPTFIVRRRQ